MNVQTESWPRPHRLTVDEYYRMAEVGLLAPAARVELIEGEIIDRVPIGSPHAAAVDVIAEQLMEAVRKSAIVRVQGPVRLGSRSEPQPDIVVLRRRPDRYRSGHPRAEDVLLIVEVSDTTLRFDLEVKAKLYAQHGIPQLWIADLNGQQMHVFRDPQDGEYTVRAIVEASALEIAALAIEVDLRELFTGRPAADTALPP